MKSKVEIDRSDFAEFLYEMGCQLKKEGNSLQALGKVWFEKSEEYEILNLFGLNISNLGKELLALRGQLCKECKLKDVTTFISYDDSQPTS